MLGENRQPVSALPPVNLGVRGLGGLSAEMVPGGIYALEARMTTARYPLFAGCLASALQSVGTASVVVPSKPEMFVERLAEYSELDVTDHLENGDLQIYVMQPEFQKKMFRFGAGSFVNELERFGVAPNSFLIFDQADDLLALHDVGMALEQMDALAKWFRERSITCLLVFSRIAEDQAWALDALMDSMTGIASIGGSGDGLELTSKYWRSPEGTIAATTYRLGNTADGYYEVVAKEDSSLRIGQVLPSTPTASPPAPSLAVANAVAAQPEPVLAPVPTIDDHVVGRVYYMDADLECLGLGDSLPWTRIDSLIGILHATLHCKDATVILSYGPKTNVRELAATVHSLRLGLGPFAHIIVRESDASLRYSNEALLLHLGVSLVIHRDVIVSRIPLMLQTLQGRTYKLPSDVAFDAALASVAPTEVRGYLASTRFEREVSHILDRAEVLDIPNALVVGVPNTHSVVDFLRVVQPARPGDMLTSDGNSCYLFLNACPPSAVGLTMSKLLAGVPGLDLMHQRVLTQAAAIREELKAMQIAARKAHFPDFSTALQEEISSRQGIQDHLELVADEDELKPAMPASKHNADPSFSRNVQAEQVDDADVVVNEEPPVYEGNIRPFDRYRYANPAAARVAGRSTVPRATRSESVR